MINNQPILPLFMQQVLIAYHRVGTTQDMEHSNECKTSLWVVFKNIE